MKAAREAGHSWAKEKAAKGNGDRVDAKKEREKADRRKRNVIAILTAFVAKAEAAKDLCEGQWRAIVRGALRGTHQAQLEDVLKRRGVTDQKGTAEHRLLALASTSKLPALRGLAFELVAARGNAYELGASLTEAASSLKVDVQAVSKASALAAVVVEKVDTLAKSKKTKARK